MTLQIRNKRLKRRKMKKYIKQILTFSSIFNDFKWLEEIKINGFNSKEKEKNYKFCIELSKLIKKYNKRNI